jgi:hypothetical protein
VSAVREGSPEEAERRGREAAEEVLPFLAMVGAGPWGPR